MKRWLLFCLAGCLLAAPDGRLTLEDVLAGVEQRFPLLQATLQERALADADLLFALGRFDTTLRTRLDSDSLGFYSNQRYDAIVEQAIPTGGMSLYGGWRRGDGDFAVYDGKLETRSLGEYRAGVRIPLFRDRAIDGRRAEVQKAQIGQRIAELSISQQRLALQQAAARRYWDWVAAGRRYRIAEGVLQTAVARDEQLREQVRVGALAAIEVTDNARAILQRRSGLVEAERTLQAASIELSLYYRDDRGDPLLAQVNQLPDSLPGPVDLPPRTVRADAEQALRKRPDLQRFTAQRAQTEVDGRLAENSRLPGIDLFAGYARDTGTGPIKRGPEELKATLLFELPFQRRAATGKLLAAEAKLKQLDLRRQYQADQITAEVRDAASAVQTAYQRALLVSDEVRVTRQLEEAERTRYELGDSTLFVLNLREQATADVLGREVSAQADYQRAKALYDLVTAQALR